MGGSNGSSSLGKFFVVYRHSAVNNDEVDVSSLLATCMLARHRLVNVG